MPKFIKLRLEKDHTDALVNISLIECIFRCGSRTVVKGAHTFLEVLETPAEILALIEKP